MLGISIIDKVVRAMKFQLVSIGFLCLVISHGLFAEEEQVKKTYYYDLDPNIITNYQRDPKRRLGFITVDVQFQVTGHDRYTLLALHKALIQNYVIDVLNSQDEAIVKDIEKRDELRELIKEKLKVVFKEETGKEVIDEVWFTKYMYR